MSTHCDHPSEQRYCDKCMPATLKVIALKNVFIENMMTFGTRETEKTVDEKRAWLKAIVNDFLLTHEAIILQPYNDARARADAAKERNYRRAKP